MSLIGIIDDDEDVPQALATLVRSLGYRARCFASGAAFLALAEPDLFSCVISDIHMPALSGLQLVPMIHARVRDLPVILMTGLMEPGLRERVADCGAIGLIVKPFTLEDLVQALRRAAITPNGD